MKNKLIAKIKETRSWYTYAGNGGVILDTSDIGGKTRHDNFYKFEDLPDKPLYEIVDGTLETQRTYSDSFASIDGAGEDIDCTDVVSMDNEEIILADTWERLEDIEIDLVKRELCTNTTKGHRYTSTLSKIVRRLCQISKDLADDVIKRQEYVRLVKETKKDWEAEKKKFKQLPSTESVPTWAEIQQLAGV